MQKNISIKADCRGMFNEEIIETILDNRGIKDVEHFLNPVESDMLPLNSLYRIDEAANIFIDGMVSGKKMMCLADVDCDGLTASATMIRYARDMGIDIKYHINLGKYHGTTQELISKVEEEKIDILIIVDSLDADIDNYKAIHDLGAATIVLDHHEVNVNIPYDDYVVLVSSNRRYSNSDLSGVGVVNKFVHYIDSILGTVYADHYDDLCAVGLLADMMSVDERHMENRYLIKRGFENIQNPAIKKIVGNYSLDSTSVLFSISPLVNASMRYNENWAALELFLSDDNKEINKYLRVLKRCKERQSEEVDELLPCITRQLDKQYSNGNKLLVGIINTEAGIAGLIGNKLLSIYNLPILIVKHTNNGYAGSARSPIPFKEICEKIGYCNVAGHSCAHGIFIKEQDIDIFQTRMENELKNVEFKTEYDIDIQLSTEDVNACLIEQIKIINNISGTGFKPISVLLELDDDFEATTMSNGRHLVCNMGEYGILKAIKWNAGNLLEEFEDYALCGDKVKVWGTLDCGYLGRNYSLRLIIDDYIVD